jgi:Mg-chelatase subunit ChlD
MPTDPALARWRLVLGRFAEEAIPGALDDADARTDRVLDFLYGRTYEGRGVRRAGGTNDPSALTVPTWLREVRELFPRETSERITRHALDRYGLTELLTDADTLRQLEPSYELLQTLLSFRGVMQGEVIEVARRIVRQVVEELRAQLEREVVPALYGGTSRKQRSRLASGRALDVRRTIRANLRNWDPAAKRLLVRELHFFSRMRRRLPWHVIFAVDCSGSMLGSVIHAAVMAGIFRGLPWLRTKLVAFDTSVVDLSEIAGDPTEVLMSVQLGGGTDIGGAMRYCASLVEQPSRTVIVVVTDFFEGGGVAPLLSTIKRLRGDGVRVLGLGALDAEARPSWDRVTAEACADAGAEVAALTPGRLAEWLATVIC